MMVFSTDPRKAFPIEFREDARPADPGLERDEAGFPAGDFSDDGCVPAAGVRAHAEERFRGIFAGDDGDHLAFVPHIKRVEPQDAAESAHGIGHRDVGFPETYTAGGGFGDFVEDGRKAAASHVPHRPETDAACGQRCGHADERRTVALDGVGDVHPRTEDRRMVIPEGAGKQDGVPFPAVCRAEGGLD